nr:hypothetical protein CFP56_24669 [Quercus suber]
MLRSHFQQAITFISNRQDYWLSSSSSGGPELSADAKKFVFIYRCVLVFRAFWLWQESSTSGGTDSAAEISTSGGGGSATDLSTLAESLVSDTGAVGLSYIATSSASDFSLFFWRSSTVFSLSVANEVTPWSVSLSTAAPPKSSGSRHINFSSIEKTLTSSTNLFMATYGVPISVRSESGCLPPAMPDMLLLEIHPLRHRVCCIVFDGEFNAPEIRPDHDRRWI